MFKLDPFHRIVPIAVLALACGEDGNDLVETPLQGQGGTAPTADQPAATGGGMSMPGGDDVNGGMGPVGSSGAGTGPGGATGESGGGPGGAGPMGGNGPGGGAAAGAAGTAGGSGGGTGGAGMMECPAFQPDLCGDECVDVSSNPAFCGDCMTACDPGAACMDGACGTAPTELAVIESCGVLTMELYEDTLYLTNDTGDAMGTVVSVPVAGGDPVTVATDQNQPGGVAVDANGVYWNTGDGSIMKAPLPMADPVALVTALDPPSLDVAVANDLVFYSNGDLFYKIATSGDDAEGTYVTCTPLNGIASAMFADADRLYWTSDARQAVETDDQTDGVLADECAEAGDEGYVELGESQGSLFHEAVYAVGGFAYWASGDQVRRAEVANPANETVAFEIDVEAVTGFTVTDTVLYMAGAGGTVQSLDYAANLAGDPLPIAVQQDTAHSLAVDATNLYWVTADCRIMAAAL